MKYAAQMGSAIRWTERLVRKAQGFGCMVCGLAATCGLLAVAYIGGVFLLAGLKLPIAVARGASLMNDCREFVGEHIAPTFGPVLAPLIAWCVPVGACIGLLYAAGWLADESQKAPGEVFGHEP